MAKSNPSVGLQSKAKTQPRKRPGRHSKRIKRRETKQTFFGRG